MATFFWIVSALAIANAIRLIRKQAADKEARNNYARHVAKRGVALESGERAGYRRAAEHEWNSSR